MLNKLYDIIEDRKNYPREGSYTNSLLDGCYLKAAKKVIEEAMEVIVASGLEGRQRTIEEGADLIYHLFVLFVAQDISLTDIEDELEKRHRKK
ncbi:MAG: phosphoribosyl-ATP diphosphatase [Anaerolineales bacterium]|jgi:phosphoribosyl-ATP pyrophosphohydrolase